MQVLTSFIGRYVAQEGRKYSVTTDCATLLHMYTYVSYAVATCAAIQARY